MIKIIYDLVNLLIFSDQVKKAYHSRDILRSIHRIFYPIPLQCNNILRLKQSEGRA